ncbi:retinitis pigmentosa 1-like 1 protein isoform X9 [Eriocheir sinensis]|uniref:retinitis pigmentosa 1-like 1 protein isoform X9 n=1 Tax=Eriocheir sinensis TaxID=95602 RepID=UPI0021C8B817|nr:retinitis pigmentosa 1-like 1 protein isoform X9 [Eriocheir sinensis]
MFSKFFCKQNIRRAVPGTCLVVGGTGAGASPAKVTLSLQLRGGCWRTTSRKVAVFTFQAASGHASSHALLDLEYLFRCSSKPSASVKICVALRCGGKRVARADLEEFLGQLTRGGRLDSFFLYIHEEKVALQQANQPIPYPATEWLFEGAPRGTHAQVKAEAQEDNDDMDELEDKYKEWKAYLEEVFSPEDGDDIDEVEDYNDNNYQEWKADLEKIFSVDDDDEVAGEATSELREASGEGTEAAGEATSEVEEASDEGTEAAGEATSEVEEASDEGTEAAGKATSEVEEASGEGTEAAGEATSEVEEVSDEGTEAAGEATSEVEEASGEGTEAAGEATSEVEEASGEGNEAAYEATSEVEEASQNGTMAADKDVPHQGESSSAVTVSATPSTASYAYRSLAVAHRFISRLAGPEDRHLEDLRRSYGVQIVRIKRTLHVKGRRDAVLKCHHSMRAKIAEWRSCDDAEAH